MSQPLPPKTQRQETAIPRTPPSLSSTATQHNKGGQQNPSQPATPLGYSAHLASPAAGPSSAPPPSAPAPAGSTSTPCSPHRRNPQGGPYPVRAPPRRTAHARGSVLPPRLGFVGRPRRLRRSFSCDRRSLSAPSRPILSRTRGEWPRFLSPKHLAESFTHVTDQIDLPFTA